MSYDIWTIDWSTADGRAELVVGVIIKYESI